MEPITDPKQLRILYALEVTMTWTRPVEWCDASDWPFYNTLDWNTPAIVTGLHADMTDTVIVTVYKYT